MRRLFRSFVVALGIATFASPAYAAGGMNYTASNWFLNNVFRSAGTAVPASLDVRIYSTCPTDASTTATTNELSGNGYSRVTYNPGTGNWGAAGGGASTAGTVQNVNASAMAFGTVATSTWNAQCIGITDGTNLWFWGPASPQGTISIGTAVSIAQNNLVLTIAQYLPEIHDYMARHGEVDFFDALAEVGLLNGVDLSVGALADAGVQFATGPAVN